MFNAHCTAGSTTTHSLSGRPPSFSIAFIPWITSRIMRSTVPLVHGLLATENRCSKPSAFASLRTTRLRKWVALSLTHVVGGPNVAHQRTSSSTVPFAEHALDGLSLIHI